MKAMFLYFLAAIFLYFLAFVTIWMILTTINLPKPGELEDRSQELFTLINQEREGLHLPKLIWDSNLAKLATEHSQHMAETDDYRHSNHPYAENIMVGTNPSEVYNAWSNSSRHYINITDPHLTRGAIGMGMKFTNLTFGSAKITISTSRAYTTFLAK